MNIFILAFFLACLTLPSAHAAISPAGPAVEVLPGGGWRFLEPTSISATPPLSRTIGTSTTGAAVLDRVSVSGPAGPFVATVGRSVPWSVLGNAIARSLPIVSTVASIASLMHDLRINEAGSQDPGTAEGNQTKVEYRFTTGGWANSKTSACESALKPAIEAQYSHVRVCRTQYQPTSDRCYYWTVEFPTAQYNCSTSPGVEKYAVHSTRQIQELGCPPVVDALTGETYIPTKSPSDGLCPTGRYTQALTQQQMATLFGQRIESAPSSAPAVAQDLLDRVGQIEGATPVTSVTGPQSQTGTPRTTSTTGPTGTVQTTITPTYSYTYTGDTITYNATNVTVTTSTTTDGTVTTETTTEELPPEKGMCDLYPDSLACAKVGTPPDADPPEPAEIPVTITPVPWGGAGSCPPPVTFTAFGVSHAFPWTPTCDVLTAYVRPLVMVLAGCYAAFIFVGGLKA